MKMIGTVTALSMVIAVASCTQEVSDVGQNSLACKQSGYANMSLAGLPPPKKFVTRHEVSIGENRIRFTATASETYLFNDDGDAIGSIFSYSYVKDSPPGTNRPVLFVTGGGPGSASHFLHVGLIGPWAVPTGRLAINGDKWPSVTPPYDLAENPNSLLDVADLVFVDTIGTGYSRAIGKGKPEDFWGIDEDADSVAQFMQLWVTHNGRWDSPKFFLGESYGGTRAALVARAVMGGPNYLEYLRAMPLNGVIVMVNTLGMPGLGNDGIGAAAHAAMALPNQSATAWYHKTIDRRGRSLQELYEEVMQFAATDYLEALQKDEAKTLSPQERAAIVGKLVAFTGLPTSTYDESLSLDGRQFAKLVLASRGLEVGVYDSRFTFVAGRGAGDPVADDAALARTMPVLTGAFHKLQNDKLQVHMYRPFAAIKWRELLPNWNFEHKPVLYGEPFNGNSAEQLAAAMNRNDKFHVMVATGYYDLLMSPAGARYATDRAGMPEDRLILKAYEAGHEPYVDDTTAILANDIRDMIRKASY